MRGTFLKTLHRFFPFDLRGDCSVPPAGDGIRISCVINFYGRLDLLSSILFSLALQRYPRDRFEVVLVEDRGGTDAGRRLANDFATLLPIVYRPLPARHGLMGASRNHGLASSRGEIVLFLDDDTVILQDDFLSLLEKRFRDDPAASAVVPHGVASFAVIDGRYDFHDPYFMTSRCTAYRRDVLAELGGFVDDFIGQEDVEFVIRFHTAGRIAVRAPELEYRHPPLLVPNFGKPAAVGVSFRRVKGRYPFPVWLLILVNCARHIPLFFLPARRFREMGRFGIGFLAGALGWTGRRETVRYS